jgi:hypothetical protein
MLPPGRRAPRETVRCRLTSAEQTARAILYPVVVPGATSEVAAVSAFASAPSMPVRRSDEQPGRPGRGITVASSSTVAVFHGYVSFVVMTKWLSL